MNPPTTIIFVHGWSVHDTVTYGELPERLAKEIPGVTTKHLHLGKYISFRDEVRMNDVANAMEAAVRSDLEAGTTFAAITQSTGGPVVRSWWQMHYRETGRACPMTHVVHLAAAQFGSALAQLGKSTLGKLKSFVESIEPGQGILDWLELGSPESWRLNESWIRMQPVYDGANPLFSFSLVGQQIDRKFYDNINPYTGELGSDGTVRVAAANLNAGYIRLVQKGPTAAQLKSGSPSALKFDTGFPEHSQDSPFCLIPGTSHVGTKMGIMRSVKQTGSTTPVVQRIKECLAITDAAEYLELTKDFRQRTGEILLEERVEFQDNFFRDRVFIHDAHSMVIVRVRDEEGYVPDNMRILFTGENGDPNKLPKGFLCDTQRNKRDRGTLTFFFNCDIMNGCPAVYLDRPGQRRKKVREVQPGLSQLGIRIEPFPDNGFAHYHPCEARGTPDILRHLIRPHETTLVDIVLKRIVRENTFAFAPGLAREDFRETKPGDALGT